METVVYIVGVGITLIGLLFAFKILKFSKEEDADIVYTFSGVTYLENGFRWSLLKYINIYRKGKGLNELKSDRRATILANARCEDMVKASAASHQGFGAVSNELNMLGADSVGENVAYGFRTAEGVFKGFLNSKSHKAIIEKKGYDYIGIGMRKNEDGRPYVCLLLIDEKHVN